MPLPKSELRTAFNARPLVARGQCIEHYGAGEAYLPVLEALGQLCRQPGGEQMVTLLSRYAPTWLVQMPALVNDSEFEALQRKVQGATRERMLREMAEAIEALTAERPLVLVTRRHPLERSFHARSSFLVGPTTRAGALVDTRNVSARRCDREWTSAPRAANKNCRCMGSVKSYRWGF